MNLKTVKAFVIISFSLALGACAIGGTVGGNGTAGGGNVNVGPINADVTPCVNLPGSTSGNCKNQGNSQGSGGTQK
nr:hypothetical protein [uncultured Rhodoferax sp.]